MNRLAAAILATAASGAVAAATIQTARAQEPASCAAPQTPDEAGVAIERCNAAIRSGALSGEALAAAFRSRGEAYLARVSVDLALRDFDQALRLNPQSTAALLSRANARMRIGEMAAAREDYTLALALNPEIAAALYGRGYAHAGLREFSAAADDFEAATRIDPNFAESWYGRAFAARRLGEEEEAARYLAEGAAIAPQIQSVFRLIIRAEQNAARGHAADALDGFNRVVRLDPYLAEGYRGRGFTHQALRAHALVVRDLEAAEALGADDGELFHRRGRAHLQMGDAAAALKDFRSAIERDEDNAAYLIAAAEAQWRSGDGEAAAPQAQRAARLDPANPRIQALLGDVLSSLGATAEATEAYQKAIALDPAYGLRIEQALARLGFSPGALDGVADAQTAAALAACIDAGCSLSDND